MINLLTSGGTYLMTFKSTRSCALWFGRTDSYIRYVLKAKHRIGKGGIMYRIERVSENEIYDTYISKKTMVCK